MSDDFIGDKYEIVGRTFESQFHGRCTLDRDHKIKRGDRVARIQRKDNPMLPIAGVVCKLCLGDLR